jgi:hypothetical protein
MTEGRTTGREGRSLMRTQRLTATAMLAVLALAMLCDVADAVEAPPAASLRTARGDARRQGLLDELDSARIDRQLLEMEVEADARQIQDMMTVLRNTELHSIQGFSGGPVIVGSSRDEVARKVALYTEKLDAVRDRFVGGSKELGRVRRRIAEYEEDLHIASPTSPARPSTAPAAVDPGDAIDADRILDLILRGLAAWGRVGPPPPLAAPRPRAEERPSLEELGLPRDADQILDWIRRAIERDRKAAEPEPTPTPGSETRREKPGATEPRPEPEEHPLKVAERILGQLLREVDRWKNR